MMQAPIRLMFLGGRRIAWDVLKMLVTDTYKERFDIRALVTDDSIWHHYNILQPYNNTQYISDGKRQTQQITDAIKKHSIDVLISIQYNWIIPGHVLDLVGHRAFNLHNARLPDYKGYHSISHAIVNADVNYQTTIHWMVESVDSGDIAYTAHTPIMGDDTAETLYLRSLASAVKIAKSLLDDLAHGNDVPRCPMPPGQGTFYAKDSIAAVADVTSHIDPEQLSRFARAAFFPPYNTAYFLHEEKKYLIVPECKVGHDLSVGEPVNKPQF